MTFNDQFSVSALMAGGWTSSDKEDLMSAYDLTDEEATALCEEIRREEGRRHEGL